MYIYMLYIQCIYIQGIIYCQVNFKRRKILNFTKIDYTYTLIIARGDVN